MKEKFQTQTLKVNLKKKKFKTNAQLKLESPSVSLIT